MSSNLSLVSLFLGIVVALFVVECATSRNVMQPPRAAAADASCNANPDWLTQDGPLALFNAPAPKRHDEGGTDCPFYQAAWQVFLYAAQPAKATNGKIIPRFIASPDFFTIEDVFGVASAGNFAAKSSSATLSLAVKSLQRANSSNSVTDPDIAAGIAQAGSLSPAIDQNGNPLYYAIHFNRVMKDFFAKPDPQKPNLRLLTRADVQVAQQDPDFPNLEFPAGSIEIKSAWQIVSDSSPPSDYIVTKASVPVLKVQQDGSGQAMLVVDSTKPAVDRTVALVGIHIVFALRDHPEFIWATFEHVDANGNPDTAPSAKKNPIVPAGQVDIVPSPVSNFLLFKTGTNLADANKVVTSADITTHFDAARQSFTKTGTPFQTSIYRVYRASLADNMKEIDDEIQAVNASMAAIFNGTTFDKKSDKRNYYRLVGAVWMDDPRGIANPNKKFVPNLFIRNMPGQSPDDLAAKVAGEDRLSGTALESFTQFEAALSPAHKGQPNCFFCHDSKAISDDQDGTLLKASKLNVSHILSRYLLNAPSPVPAPPHNQ